MQLTFGLSSNVIFQHIVIIFYTSSVYLNVAAVCMIAISTDTWKSYRFCTPVEDEKTLSILFFFFFLNQIILHKKEDLFGKY